MVTAPEVTTTAEGDNEFTNSFPMDAAEEANLLNSRLSKDAEEEAKMDLEAEMGEDAAEAGRVPGGDGDGNAVCVRGGKSSGDSGSGSKKTKRKRGRHK